MLKLSNSVRKLPGVGPTRTTQLEQLGVTSLVDLLNWLPRRYLDCTKPVLIKELQLGQLGVVMARVISVNQRRTRSRKILTSALLQDESGSIEALWFNQPYLEPILRRVKRVLLVGPVRRHYQSGRLILAAPKVEEDLKVIPIYPLTEGITSRQLGRLITVVLDQVKIRDPLSAEIRAEVELISRDQAWQQIHQPQSILQVQAARRRLVFDQLLVLQRSLAKLRQKLQKKSAPPIKLKVELLRAFSKSLPYKLTDDQRRAIWQMAQELSLEKSQPMHRLLNGDVGSGKTVVAAALLLLVVKSGFRGVLMAPTEILAQQHAQTLRQLLKPFDVSVGLVTAQTKQTKRDVLVGTHALISPGVDLSKVALTVIDEQHRFGVEQREQLHKKTNDQKTPHLLTLTATPIPRSLALVLFGDLDVTLLQELPAGRRPIKTTVVEPSQEAELFEQMRAVVKRGEQVYVVCPLIEEQVGDFIVTDERQSVAKVFKLLSREVFPKLKVEAVHGRMKSEEKEGILQRFRDGEVDILVSTSVVEVGMDIPNATVMLIESAERFGIAQLHQLRGRIGRRAKPSRCFLMVREPSAEAVARCRKVASTNNGFKLARFDLQQRGPGELVGLAQKGINQLFLGDLDFELLVKAQEIARRELGV